MNGNKFGAVNKSNNVSKQLFNLIFILYYLTRIWCFA